MAEIHEFARTRMIDAQQRYQDQADKQRTTAPQFRPGDLVWFLANNTCSVRPSRKLNQKREGHFKLMEDPNLKTPYAYRLDFPADIKLHPVRHISKLEPAANDPYPGQIITPLPPLQMDGEEKWEVEEVLDAKVQYRKLQYIIKWTSYDIPDWRDATNVNGLQATDIFHRRYPQKPGPLPEDQEGEQAEEMSQRSLTLGRGILSWAQGA